MVVMLSWKCPRCGFHRRSVLFQDGTSHAHPLSGEWCYTRLEPVLSPKIGVLNANPSG